jgi:thymidylate kinase
MSRKPIVIIFIGNVGAGKTTHISLAYSLLKKRGYKVHKTYVKTFFIITRLLSRLHLLRKNIRRITVSLDLLLNSIYLPLMTWIRTILFPKIARKQIVLVEEHLPGSLVDFVLIAVSHNLTPIVKRILRTLIMLSRKNLWHVIIYIAVDKKLLPERWLKRGSPPEIKRYLLIQDLVFSIIMRYNKEVFGIVSSKDLHYNSSLITNFILTLLNRAKDLNIP